MIGRYVVLEGPDGSGKGTQCDILQQRLEAMGIAVERVVEPGGVDILGKLSRSILKGMEDDPFIVAHFGGQRPEIEAWEAVLWFNANRRRLLSHVARQIQQGIWVLADRNLSSTIAYQGYGEGLDLDDIRHVCRIATQEIKPDLTLILHASYHQTHQRTENRGTTDRFESKGGDFLERVNRGYLAIANDDHIPLIDASRTVEQVAQDILDNHIKPLLKETSA